LSSNKSKKFQFLYFALAKLSPQQIQTWNICFIRSTSDRYKSFRSYSNWNSFCILFSGVSCFTFFPAFDIWVPGKIAMWDISPSFSGNDFFTFGFGTCFAYSWALSLFVLPYCFFLASNTSNLALSSVYLSLAWFYSLIRSDISFVAICFCLAVFH
jgi:hypothetical protein